MRERLGGWARDGCVAASRTQPFSFGHRPNALGRTRTGAGGSSLHVPVRLGAVDVGSALNLVGGIIKYLSLAFFLPIAVALLYREPWWPFVVAGLITLGAGWGLERATQGRERVGTREGFLVVSLTWVLLPAFGTIPYLLADEPQLSRPVDAYFEAVSGFTATGATVLTSIEALSRSVAMWRQFTQWLGGMGIIVLALAVLPRLRVGGRQLLQSELAGPTEIERLSATIRETARRLWGLYVGLTVLAIAILAGFGWTGLDPTMNLYDATAHAFSTIAIGGFSTRSRSVEVFGAITQWTIVCFIALAGLNFLRLYRALIQRQIRAVARDDEFRLYCALLVAGSGLLFLELVGEGTASGEAAVRSAVFQAVSIMTTTGFASADYTRWSTLAEMTLLLLMFVGASAGSTGGSIKVVRHLLVAKIIRRELDQAVHREAVVPIRLTGTVVDERALRAISGYIVLYLAVFALGAAGLVIETTRTNVEVSTFEAIGAAAAAIGNVGPAFGFAGPMGSYAPFSDVAKTILIALMWLGRLEIVPIAVLFMRSYWRS